MSTFKLRSAAFPRLEVEVHEGHFATRTCHKSHYLDVTPIKHDHLLAREAAMALAGQYAWYHNIDTIVCMDGSEVIGAFLARHIAKKDRLSVNQDKHIHVISPEYDFNHQLIFRENLASQIRDKDVLVLISTVNSGATARRALDTVRYYGGNPQGITSIFSTLKEVEDFPVFSLFSPEDIPGYFLSSTGSCPACAAGKKLTAIINSYGFSAL